MLAALVIGLLLVVAAAAVPILADPALVETRLSRRLQGPSWMGGDGGLLGTDQLGRDLFVRIMHGLRTSFVVGALGAALAAIIGTTIGLLAGYLGGFVDAVLMRITDVQLAFPGLLLVIVIVQALGHGAGTLVVVLAIVSWMLYARVVRGAVLSLRSSELITAIEGLGASTGRILLVHVLPNVFSAAVAVAAVNFAALMMAEATLSFLGFGIQPPQVSLGAILASGRAHLTTSWWVSTFSGLFLMLAVLSTNLLGTWLHRTTDPAARVRL